MVFPPDYIERVYSGVLGKIIGVYLGRPFEGWSYEKIMQELGEVNYYVHDKIGVPLIVTDDDISGTFTFVRALADHANRPDLSPEQIGQTWLNYLIERKTILWWGGLGNSTEHTAYLRLKAGIPAPQSGSIAVNGPIVAQQIGAQIFIDGWAMVAPGDPQRAADLARRAGSVSHDGEALYGAQVLAAMEAQAFVERNIDCLIDTGVSFIPKDSIIYRLIADLRDWKGKDGDWRKTRARIVERYGYKDYIGGCHMVPNHALIHLGLLYGEGDFQKSLMICNTAGWDTDCNSGNLGCLMGIRNGLAGFEGGVDWRGPVADRLYLPTMDGGRAVTDAVRETYAIVNSARGLQGQAPLQPKDGARFHFELPGSLQGFTVRGGGAGVVLANEPGHSRKGTRSLAVRWNEENSLALTTATFIQPADRQMPGYELIASPTLYPGQALRAGLAADASNPAPLELRFVLGCYDAADQPAKIYGPAQTIWPGAETELTWSVPALDGMPIFAAGVEVAAGTGALYLDYFTWDGAPRTVFGRPKGSPLAGAGPQSWRWGWVEGLDVWEKGAREPFRVIQNSGRGLLATGAREWQDYRVTAQIRPALVKAGGLAVHVQGLRRFYALEFVPGSGGRAGGLRLLKVVEDQETTLAESALDWQLWQAYELSLEVKGRQLRGWVDGRLLFRCADPDSTLDGGGVGLVVEEGHLLAGEIRVEPVSE